MKIEVGETITANFEVVITLEDVLQIWMKHIKNDPTPRGVGFFMAWMTSMMSKIPPEIIGQFSPTEFNRLDCQLHTIIDKFSAARALSLNSPELADRTGDIPAVTPT